jgi:hypothetical protein
MASCKTTGDYAAWRREKRAVSITDDGITFVLLVGQIQVVS